VFSHVKEKSAWDIHACAKIIGIKIEQMLVQVTAKNDEACLCFDKTWCFRCVRIFISSLIHSRLHTTLFGKNTAVLKHYV